MIETVIGTAIVSSVVLVVLYIRKNGLHLSEYDRAMYLISQHPGFECDPETVTLIQKSIKPAAFIGFALDDAHKQMMCFDTVPGVVCRYDQIVEWRLIVNNRSVAHLSRLSSMDLQVNDPDRGLNIDDFLRKYCEDQRQDPILESVVIKFLINDLSYPVHSFSLRGLEQGPFDLHTHLRAALAQIDKFKIIMYRDAPLVLG